MLVGVRPTGTGLLWADSGNLTPARPAKLDKYQPAAALKKSPPQTLAKIQALPARSVLFAFDWDGQPAVAS